MANKHEVKIVVNGQTANYIADMDKATAASKRFYKEIEKTEGGGRKLQKGFQNLSNQASILNGPLNGVSGRLSATATALGRVSPAMVAAGAAMSGLAVIVTKGVNSLRMMEEQMLRIEGVLQATGGASGYTANQIQELSREIAYATLASVEGVRSAASKLLTFRSVSQETFERTLWLAQDLADLGFGNIETAAVQLGKALEDPEKGLTSLTRVGVSFSEDMRNQIELLGKSGQIFEQQALILGEVERQAGGVAKAVAGGLNGSIDTVSYTFQEFTEDVAKAAKAMEIYKFAIDKVNKAMVAFRDHISEEEQQNRRLEQMATLREKIARLREKEARQGGLGLFDTAELRDYIAVQDKLFMQAREHISASAREEEQAIAALKRSQKEREAIQKDAIRKAKEEQQKFFDQKFAAAKSHELAIQIQEAQANGEKERAAALSYQKTLNEIKKRRDAAIKELQGGVDEEAHLKPLLAAYANQGVRAYQAYQAQLEKIRDERHKKDAEAEVASIKEMARIRNDILSAQRRAASAGGDKIGAELLRNEGVQARIDAAVEEARIKGELTEEVAKGFETLREEALKEHYARIRQIQKDQIDTEVKEAEEAEKKKVAARDKYLDAYGDMFSNMAKTAAIARGRESNAYKAFAIAMATIDSARAINSVWASELPYYAKVVAVAATAAATAAQIGTIASTNISSRAMGGDVSAGNRYWVGERGPELLTMGTASGRITPASEIGGQPIVNIVESNNSEEQGSVSFTDGELTIIVNSVRDSLRRDMASGRGLAQSMNQSYAIGRRF